LGEKTPVAIHQFHASLAWGDAIGNDLFALRRLFRKWGYRSEIFRIYAQEEVAHDTHSVDEYPSYSSPRNLLLVHYSTGWESFPEFMHLHDTRILVYHNITPCEYFEGFSEQTASLCRKGRNDLPDLNKYFSAAIADSAFNGHELIEAGFRNVVTIPPLIDFSQYDNCTETGPRKPNTTEPTVDWLFVGRISPNKKQEDLLSAFAFYQKHIQPASRLSLVGSDHGMEEYGSYLQRLAGNLELNEVHFAGKVSFAELLNLYRSSTVFVSLSEHEGFCIPLLECMKFGLPIVAYANPAVEETLQGSGILLQEKSPEIVAEAVDLLVSDASLRDLVVQRQCSRLEDFSYHITQSRMESFLQQFGVRSRRSWAKRRMHIACSTLRYYPHIGGAEIVLQNVLERLAKDEFDCTVYATDAKAVEDIFVSSRGQETEESINGVRVVRSPVTDPPRKAWLACKLDRLSIYGHGAWSYGQFVHLLRDEYDILHSSPFPSTHNYLAYIAARARQKPFVCSPHLHIADTYHSDRRSLFFMMRHSAAVMANTSYERDFCVSRRVPFRIIHVTGVGVDPASAAVAPQLPAAALSFSGFSDAKKFVFVGRKDPGKGIPDILNAMRLLRLRHPNVVFVCAGPETAFSRSLWQEVPRSLRPHLLVLDAVSEAEKHTLITNSEALILTSTTESFGIVFLEAWLRGRPVIGARAGAIQAVVDDGGDGLLVEPGNYVELATAMEFLIENPEAGAALGTRGREKTLKQFTWDKIAEDWASIFWQISKSK